jgi:hypothetical protein
MKHFGNLIIVLLFAISLSTCKQTEVRVEQWTSCELTLLAAKEYTNPYTDMEVWAIFTNGKGDSLIRPAFWDGENKWKIRFSPPDANDTWNWVSYCSNTSDNGLHQKKGTIKSKPYSGNNALFSNGLLCMSEGRRNVVHRNGKPFLVVGDTPWALPFRATTGQVDKYARHRKSQGFNTALLMVVQPDMRAEGPDARNTETGFARAFYDLHKGSLNEMNPRYFQTLDSMITILTENGIVPVYQPVFHGFGWKGLDVLGNSIAPEEYVRFCKYLLARYGSMPAMWLLGADNDGNDPGVAEGGEMLEKWDCYKQPTGIHYNPCGDYVAEWSVGNPLKRCMHWDNSHQEKEWLDFQWTQTGHDGVHNTAKVWRMYDNKPTKAVANGEPTYEGMGNGKNGLGWWQGHEAWMQFMSGGTMGVVYGAASLWQWKITDNETGWTEWSSQPLNWEKALLLKGADYIGYFSNLFAKIDFTDMERNWERNKEKHPMLHKGNQLFIAYMENGGKLTIPDLDDGMYYFWFNPRNGECSEKMELAGAVEFTAPDVNPWVFVLQKNIKMIP